MPPPAHPTGELQHLRIFASAVAGRAVEVVAADPGDRTWTDGQAIYLETDVAPADRQRLLAAQASMLHAGSLDPDVLPALRRNRSLARAYLAVEGHRALAANEAVLPTWMERLIDRRVADLTTSPADSLRAARQGARADPDWVLGTIEPKRIRPVDAAADGVAAAVTEAERRLDETEATRLDELDDDAGGADLGNLLSSPVGGGGPLGRVLAKLLRPARSRTGSGSPGADAPTHMARGRPGASGAFVSLAPAPALQAADAPDHAGRSYPEWDERQQRYRADWCHVVEDEAVAGPVPMAMPGAEPTRRALGRLGLGLTPCRRRQQGDDIDIDAVVSARVDLAAGSPHDGDLYIENLRRRRDLSVLVLLDVSGSAAEPGVAGRSVHEHQRDAAACLASALHDLGDRSAVLAFNSSGRKAVRVRAVKRFDELFGGRVLRRFEGLTAGGYTRLGAAIRHGAAILDEGGGTPWRVLVVLSDGFAYDHGYEGPYAEADARRALSEARRRGIGCLCLSVGAGADAAALRRVFGPAAHAALPTAERLPAVIAPLFAAALRSAEAQRRREQRTERTRERLRIEEGSR